MARTWEATVQSLGFILSGKPLQGLQPEEENEKLTFWK